jgi:1-acyl-sn-glycerol-3-phosphate acyltransferase
LYHRAIHLFLSLLTWLICRVEVEGREHIPEQAPFLVVTNHLSAVDPPLLFSLIPARLRMTGMAAMTHRSDFMIGWFMDRGGAVWVRRGESDRRALRQSLEVLESGRPLGVAPEGTRSHTGALIEGKTGVAFLASKAQVPILPVAVVGTEKVLPALRRLRRKTVHVRIETAFRLPERGDRPRREHTAYCTDLIMTRLASMLPESYRGVYSGHPLISYWQQLDVTGCASHPEWVQEPVLRS